MAFHHARIPVQAFIAPERNWHAKIAVRFDAAGNPVAGIVGSSNLTGPAFRDDYQGWNYEADVLLWVPAMGLDDYFHRAVEGIKDPFGKMFLNLNERVEQPNESKWLKTLADDVVREDGGLQPFQVHE